MQFLGLLDLVYARTGWCKDGNTGVGTGEFSDGGCETYGSVCGSLCEPGQSLKNKTTEKKMIFSDEMYALDCWYGEKCCEHCI